MELNSPAIALVEEDQTQPLIKASITDADSGHKSVDHLELTAKPAVGELIWLNGLQELWEVQGVTHRVDERVIDLLCERAN